MAILVNDDFTGADSSAPDAAKWSPVSYVNFPAFENPPTAPRITGNQLVTQSPGNSRSYAVSSSSFDLTAGGAHVKLVDATTSSGSVAQFSLHSTFEAADGYHYIATDGGATLLVKSSGGYNFSRAYNPTTDVFLRLQVLGGTVQAYTSPTGAAGSWVAVGAATPLVITATSVRAVLMQWRWTNFAAGDAGVVWDTFQIDTSAIGTASADVAGIASNVPDGRIFRHSGTTWAIGNTGSIVETGLYTGFTPNQIRLVQDGTNTPLSGFDWTAIGSAAAGTYSHTFNSVPQAVGTGWYNVQVRDSGVPATIYSTGKRGVGIHICVYGQSQSTGNANTGDNTLNPTGMSMVHGEHYGGTLNWSPLVKTSMNGYIAADITLNALTGGKVPIAFLNLGYPATSLTTAWLPTAASVYYQYAKNKVAELEGKVDAIVHIAGETDAAQTVTQAAYHANMGTLFAQSRADFGYSTTPIVVVMLGYTNFYWTDAAGEQIKKAQAQRCLDVNMYRVESYDVEMGGDSLHRSPAGYAEVARRWATAIGKALGLTANYRSPRITGVAAVSSTVFDATIAYDGATDYTPLTSITGLRITDSVLGTALTTTSVVHQSATKIRITLASAPANAPTVAVAYGATPASNFADNSALTLPLEYTDGVLSSAYIAKRCTLTLTTNGSTPAASQSGIVWAWYDAAPPNLAALPAVAGTGATTNASGVLDVVIDGTALAAGQVGTLLAVVSNGTPGSAANKAFCAPVAVS